MDSGLLFLYKYLLKLDWVINDYSVSPDGSVIIGIKEHKHHQGGLVIKLTPCEKDE